MLLFYLFIGLSIIIVLLITAQPSTQQSNLFNLSEGSEALFNSSRKKFNFKKSLRMITLFLIAIWFVLGILASKIYG